VEKTLPKFDTNPDPHGGNVLLNLLNIPTCGVKIARTRIRQQYPTVFFDLYQQQHGVAVYCRIMWVKPDVIRLLPANVGWLANNVVPAAPILSINVGRAPDICGPLQLSS
jgi:hypothetical protein